MIASCSSAIIVHDICVCVCVFMNREWGHVTAGGYAPIQLALSLAQSVLCTALMPLQSHTHTHARAHNTAGYLFSLHVIVGVLGMEIGPSGSAWQHEHRQNANDVHMEVHGPERDRERQRNRTIIYFPLTHSFSGFLKIHKVYTVNALFYTGSDTQIWVLSAQSCRLKPIQLVMSQNMEISRASQWWLSY